MLMLITVIKNDESFMRNFLLILFLLNTNILSAQNGEQKK